MKSLIFSALLACTFTSYSQSILDFGHLPGEVVRIVETSNQEVYVATDSGLFHTQSPTVPFQQDTTFLPSSGISISSLHAEGNSILVGTNKGVYYTLTGGAWLHADTVDGLLSNYVNDVTIDGNGHIWLATNVGLAEYDGFAWLTHTPFADSVITAVTCVGSTIYAGNWSFGEAIKKFQNGSWTTVQGSILSKNRTERLAKGPNGSLMVGTSGGVFTFTAQGVWNYFYNQTGEGLISGVQGNVSGLTTKGRTELYLWNGQLLDTAYLPFNGGLYNIDELSASVRPTSFWIGSPDTTGSRIFLFDYSLKNIPVDFIGGKLRGCLSANGALFDRSANGAPAPGLFYNNNVVSTGGGGVWLADNNAALPRTAVSYYNVYGSDWSAGPVANSQSPAYSAKYNKVWRVTQNQIASHIANSTNPNYTPHPAISSWPGNGDTTNGEAWILAPFIDLDEDGVYEPEDGEYPEILGVECLFAIANESNKTKLYSQSPAMGIEMHVMLYVQDSLVHPGSKDALHVHVELKARRGVVNNVVLGTFFNFNFSRQPLWTRSDNFSSSSQRLTANIYDDIDGGAVTVVGLSDTAVGVRFLGSDWNNNTPWFDVPNTRMGIWNALHSKFNDGVPITQFINDPNFWNGVGYYPDTVLPTTQWHFDYDNGWRTTYNDYEGQLASFGERDLDPAENHCFDFALNYNAPIELVDMSTFMFTPTVMYAEANTLRTDFLAGGGACLGVGLSVEDHIQSIGNLNFYPNPTKGNITIPVLDESSVIVLYSIDGRMLQSIELEPQQTQVNLNVQPKGLYILERRNERGEVVREKLMFD